MEYDVNTSALVRDALPDVIEPSEQGKEGKEGKPTIRIRKYQRDTRDTYDDVRKVSKELWGNNASLFADGSGQVNTDVVDIDIILHFGMIALGWDPNQFRFETLARRNGYTLPGDDGKLVDSAELEREGLPPVLKSTLDVEGAWRQVHAKFPDVKTSVSDDAGLYFCEFRLYSSLAEAVLIDSLESKRGRTTFLHLPQAYDDEAIALARGIAVAFITGLVDGLVEEEKKAEKNGGE